MALFIAEAFTGENIPWVLPQNKFVNQDLPQVSGEHRLNLQPGPGINFPHYSFICIFPLYLSYRDRDTSSKSSELTLGAVAQVQLGFSGC